MIVKPTKPQDVEFTPPGVIQVSASALKLAREFQDTIRRTQRGDWVVVFDWATSVEVRREPGATPEPIPDCVMLGASERRHIPARAIHVAGGIEFAIQIPKAIWQSAVQRLIDTDPTLLFKLALR